MIISREDLAWAAGLYEGEGTVCRARTSRFLSLTSTDEDVVLRFREAVGMGQVTGPYGPHPPRGKKVYWTWRVCNFEHRQAVTALLWDWLSPRRKVQLTESLAWDRKPGDYDFGKGRRNDLMIKT